MQFRRAAYQWALALAAVLATAGAAEAQSFFQSLFGFGSPPRHSGRQPVPRVPAAAYSPVPSLKSFSRYSPYGAQSSRPYEQYDDDDSRSASLGSYRTMCVRTCDGFYWPIRSSASHSQFYRDAKICESSCDCEARLYYLPRWSDDVEHMTDLTGRTYGSLEMAFKYRKALSKGCSCKPSPWTAAEMARHRTYAVAAIMQEQERRMAEAEASAEKAMVDARTRAPEPMQMAEADIESPPSEPAAPGDEPETIAEMPGHAVPGFGAKPDNAVESDFRDNVEGTPVEPGLIEPGLSEATPVLSSDDAQKSAQRPRRSQRQAAVRSGRASGVTKTSWLPGSKAKYTWPGDTR